MNTRTAVVAAILALSTVASAGRSNPARDPQTVSGFFANRIVGTYQTDEGQVGVCGAMPNIPIGNTMSFNAGGTVIENPLFAPAGVMNVFGIPGLYTRTIGLGTWSYSPRTNRYSMHLRYDFFENGVFYGVGTVDRDLKLSADGNKASGSVQSTIYAADGRVIVDLCGTATSTRLQ